MRLPKLQLHFSFIRALFVPMSCVCSRYLHNWTGNRVTVRDWFQLCLKEGLTVFRCAAPSTCASLRAGVSCGQLNVRFRDQQFSSSLTSSLDNRLQQVRTLLATQFAEDAGPLAHAVRPQSYVEINNFYTSTVYEKGAELCRMMHVIIGAAAFRTGMDLYFETYDGQAVTMEDWVDCMLQAASSHGASFVPSKQQWMLWCAFFFLTLLRMLTRLQVQHSGHTFSPHTLQL